VKIKSTVDEVTDDSLMSGIFHIQGKSNREDIDYIYTVPNLNLPRGTGAYPAKINLTYDITGGLNNTFKTTAIEIYVVKNQLDYDF